jgi:hypothetical protein
MAFVVWTKRKLAKKRRKRRCRDHPLKAHTASWSLILNEGYRTPKGPRKRCIGYVGTVRDCCLRNPVARERSVSRIRRLLLEKFDFEPGELRKLVGSVRARADKLAKERRKKK